MLEDDPYNRGDSPVAGTDMVALDYGFVLNIVFLGLSAVFGVPW